MSTRRPRILVVEDEPDIRRFVAITLEEQGFEVALACDGPEAVTLAKRNRPQLVVLDFMLPGGDGETVARDLRAVCGDVPILLMSAADDLGQKAFQVGAFSRLDKPFDLDHLVVGVLRGLQAGGLNPAEIRVRENVRGARARSARPSTGGAGRTKA